MNTEPRRFEVTGRLPDRSMALEASAGTGKTWTLSSLALRYLAERDVTLPELLMVTFTRAATAELRDRVRVRIAGAIREAERALADPAWHSADPVLDRVVGDALRRGGPELRVRLTRLETAAQQFDDATISTIHGFCQRMLQHAALEAGVDFDAVLLEDDRDLVTELVDDHLVRSLRHADVAWVDYLRKVGGVGRDRLTSLARAVSRLPALRLLPDDLPEGDPLDPWEQARTAFRRTWEGGGRDEVVALVGRLADEGGFVPRQRTFTARAAEEHAARVDAWLAADHRIPPGGPARRRQGHHQPDYPMAYFTAAAIEAKLAEGVPVPEHRVLADATRLLDHVTTPATLFLQQAARGLWSELDRRKRQRTVLTFDDLLARLADALEDDASREAVRAAIRQRYRVALIDEFQDTDAVQWRIFSRLFGPDEPFVLIGDPKQAIYSFRGADINTYLRARDTRPEHGTLQTNFRSDASYVAACNALFGAPGAFATDAITYRSIQAHHTDRLHDPIAGAALQVRYIHRDAGPPPDEDRGARPAGVLPKGWIDRHLPQDVAQEVIELLTGGLELHGPDGEAGPRPLLPHDVAVLVRTNRRADAVQAALRSAGVPAIIQRGGSVFATAEADALQRLLDALLRPGDDRLAVAAAASTLFARDAATLVALREDPDGAPAGVASVASWDTWIEALRRWSDRWQRDGVLAALRQAFAEDGMDERLLAGPAGDRRVTNLRHLLELLHTAETTDDVQPGGLAEWLRARRADAADGELPTVETELRLEGDAEAVRVVTVHGSKGLQYPVVLCPDLWDGRIRVDEAVTRFHDVDAEDPRQAVVLDVDVDRSSVGKRHSIALARDAEVREQLRLAYVALTRAQHRCVVWWGPVRDAPTSALASLFHGPATAPPDGDGPASDGHAADDPHGRLGRAAARLSASDTTLLQDLEALAARAEGAISIRVLTAFRAGGSWDPPAEAPTELDARRFTRMLDRRWRRTSFTALAHDLDASEAGPVADGGRDVDTDTGGDPVERPDGDIAPDEVPLARFPRGAGPGTFLHDVLERLDFTAADGAALPALLADLEVRHGIAAAHRPAVVAGLRAALATPLGEVAAGARLADLARPDRLDELRFELPLGSGTSAGGFSWSAVGEAAGQSGDMLLRAYAERLRDPASAAAPPPIRGYLTGSIDLVARLPDGRFLVADYKSNWLGARATGRARIEDYRPARLHEAMIERHYVLQALLYLVATHRYLRWRVPGYDYDTHVAGAAYLFLRGMIGPSTPTGAGGPHGVAVLRPSGATIEALSARFDGGRA